MMTAEELLAQGQCCGLGCKHCPYQPKHTKGSTMAVLPKLGPALYMGQRVMTPHGAGVVVNQDRVTTHSTDPKRDADGMLTMGIFGVLHDVLPEMAKTALFKDNILYYWPREITTC